MEAYYDQCGYDAERKEKERKTRIRKLWRKAYRGVLIQKKVQRMFAGATVDPTIERLMMNKMNDDPEDRPPKEEAPKKATAKKGNANNSNKKRNTFIKGKLFIHVFGSMTIIQSNRVQSLNFNETHLS